MFRNRGLAKWPFVGFFAAALCLGVQASTESALKKRMAAAVAGAIQKYLGKPAQLDAATAIRYGVPLSAEKTLIAREDFKALLSNPVLPMYIANSLVGGFRPNGTTQEIDAVVSKALTQLKAKGFARLPSDRQAALVAHTVKTMQSVDAEDCEAMILGELDLKSATALENRHIAGLPAEEFKAISGIYREAMEAELSGAPDVKTVDARQDMLASEAYSMASRRRLQEKLSPATLRRASERGSTPTAAERCAVVSESIAAILDIAEPYRSWQLIRFVQQLQ